MSAFFLRGNADTAVPFSNDSTRKLADRIILAHSPEYYFFSLPYDNPATRQYQAPFSISSLYAGYHSESYETAITTAEGRGERRLEIGADSYLKYKSSTVWGAAYYNNGRILSPRWNETSDADLLYPYLTADSVGGDMNLERYRFMGGYADHKGRWNWGGEIGYLAGLYYRSVDPRPKNITGTLTFKAGAGYSLSRVYSLSIGTNASRYQQSNEITFVSETSESKIYHSTGLGTHYVRFAGTGKNSKYSGWRYGGSIQLISKDSPGFIAAVSAERFKFEKIIIDLNRLPLAEATDFNISGELGYRGIAGNNVWMIGATFLSHSRKGKENIFGDPSMSIYPQISTLDKFSASDIDASVSALWSLWKGGVPVFSLKPSATYSSSHESYRTPNRSADIDALTASLLTQGNFKLPTGITTIVTLTGSIYSPISSSLKMDGTYLSDDEGLVKAWQADFNASKSTRGYAGASLSLAKPISSKFSLSLDLEYSRMFFPEGNSGNMWGMFLSAYF